VWILDGTATSAVSALVEHIIGLASPVEFVVASGDLLSSIEVWRPGGLDTPTDWFGELGIDRMGSRE
jgi:hypothetical protein